MVCAASDAASPLFGMTLLDLVATYPAAEDVIRSFDKQAGSCLLCEALFLSSVEVSARYPVNRGEFLRALQSVLGGRGALQF